jgi:hypothetical protein
MNIQLFLNKKGLIYGGDNKRICCDRAGVLKIGGTEIAVTNNIDCIMPQLFYGASGDYEATYTTHDGEVYRLEKVAVRNGRVLPPPSTAVELMELHCREDKAELERAEIKERLEELSNIFDTNSLNFIIGGNNI